MIITIPHWMVGQIGVTTDLAHQIQLLVISTIKAGFLAL